MTRRQAAMTVAMTAILAFMTYTGIASAAAVHYDCTNFPNGGVSCTAGTLTFSGNQTAYNAGGGLTLTQGATYYASFVVSGSGTGKLFSAGNSNDGTMVSFTNGATVAQSFVVATGNTWNSFALSSNGGSFSGTVSNICIADVAGDCETGPTPSTGGATSTIEQTQQNLAWGFLIFLVSMWGIIWLIRKH